MKFKDLLTPLNIVVVIIILTLVVLIYKQREGYYLTREEVQQLQEKARQEEQVKCKNNCQSNLDSCSKPCKDGYQNCMNYTCQNKCLYDCRDLLPSIAPTQKDIRDYQECQQNCPAKCAPICANELAQCGQNCVSTFDSCVNTCN